jgi:hypothetical protein
MNVHLETMLKLEFTPAVETETERSALIFRLKRLAQLCTEPRKVYILVREFIGGISASSALPCRIYRFQNYES